MTKNAPKHLRKNSITIGPESVLEYATRLPLVHKKRIEIKAVLVLVYFRKNQYTITKLIAISIIIGKRMEKIDTPNILNIGQYKYDLSAPMYGISRRGNCQIRAVINVVLSAPIAPFVNNASS